MNEYYIFSQGDYLNGRYLVDGEMGTSDMCKIHSVSFMGQSYTAMVFDYEGLEEFELPRNQEVIDSFNMDWRGERYTVLIRPGTLTCDMIEDSFDRGRFINYWEGTASTIHNLAQWLISYKQNQDPERQYYKISLDNVAECVTDTADVFTCLLDVHSEPYRQQDESELVKALASLLLTLITGDRDLVLSPENITKIVLQDSWLPERRAFILDAMGLGSPALMNLQTFCSKLGTMYKFTFPTTSASEESTSVLGQVACNVEFQKTRKGQGGFRDVAGMEQLKQELKRDVLFALEHPEKAARYKLKPLNGMVLYGPPGCGKTYIAQKFAEESGQHFALVKGSDLANIYYHGTQSMIGNLFEKALQHTPCVICIDELDSFIYKRENCSGDHSMHIQEVDEFLTRLNNCGEKGIFVIGTTNRPDLLDAAALRSGRLEKKVYVPLPDAESRKCLFQAALDGRPVLTIDADKLACATEGYVASDIQFIVNQVALDAAMADELITQDAILDKLKTIPSSLTQDQLKEYQEFFNTKSKPSQNRPAIGFTVKRA